MAAIKRNKLTNQQYAVAREGATEPPFSGKYNDEKRQGIYLCVVCRETLFQSNTKFESGSGWPSFFDSIENKITRKKDFSHGMVRIEITCAFCDAHLGHVFNDGPAPSGQRYCVNSLSMEFVANE